MDAPKFTAEFDKQFNIVTIKYAGYAMGEYYKFLTDTDGWSVRRVVHSVFTEHRYKHQLEHADREQLAEELHRVKTLFRLGVL